MKQVLPVVLESLPHRHAAHRLRQTYALLDQGWQQRHRPDPPPGTMAGHSDDNQQMSSQTTLKEEEE